MDIFLKAALGALLLFAAEPAFAQNSGWTVSEASGHVVLRDASGEHPLGRGASVAPGTTLLTGTASRAVLVRGDDFVTVSPSSSACACPTRKRRR